MCVTYVVDICKGNVVSFIYVMDVCEGNVVRVTYVVDVCEGSIAAPIEQDDIGMEEADRYTTYPQVHNHIDSIDAMCGERVQIPLVVL